MGRARVVIVEQSARGVSRAVKPPMPLAGGYLKAMVLADPELDAAYEVDVLSCFGRQSAEEILAEVLEGGPPAIVGLSVLGWNFHKFVEVTQRLRALKPGCWVIWGGSHVSFQTDRVYATPGPHVLVHGEAEMAWRELLHAHRAAGGPTTDLGAIAGVSFRQDDGEVVTTAERGRIVALDEIPSPFLTGALSLTSEDGGPRYDFALMETNRGCPYSCAFCYWGGAIGTKVRCFSPERLEVELELIARAGYDHLTLCDANFGALPGDEAFLESLIRVKNKYGQPRRFLTSWAKNKGRQFRKVLARMKASGLGSAFNFALQSLSDIALDDMGRRNMQINDWGPLAEELIASGFDVYAELIWGAPGDTVEGFLAGYDLLAKRIPQIAVYPLLIMPNTDYAKRREELGLVTFTSDEHDFELVRSHKTLREDENRQMHRFLFWARALGEHLYFRRLWAPLRELAGLEASAVMLDLDAWIDTVRAEPAPELRRLRSEVVARLEADETLIEPALRLLCGHPGANDLFHAWWSESLSRRVPVQHRGFIRDVLALDLATRPLLHGEVPDRSLVAGDDGFLERPGVAFDYPVQEVCAAGCFEPNAGPSPVRTLYDIRFKAGFAIDMTLFHSAHNKIYLGEPVRRA